MRKITKIFISFLLAAVTALSVGTLSYAASSFTTKSKFTGKTYTHYGNFAGTQVRDMIDVSEHNGLINWYKIKALGINEAIVRVGYRGYGKAGNLVEDKYFYDNMDGAIEAGVKVGVYIYSQALDTTEAIAEANYALKRVKGYKLSLPIFFDYEFAEVADGRLDYAWASGALNKTKMTKNVIAFCDTVKKAGYKAGLYSSSGFFTYQYNADTFLAKDYELWNAYYTTNSTAGSYWPNKHPVYRYWQYGGGNVQGCCGAPSAAWIRVEYGGRTGYVSAQYVNFTGASAGTSLADGLNLRAGEGTGYASLAKIPKGAKMKLLSYPKGTNTDLNFYYASASGAVDKPAFSLDAGQNSVKVAWKSVAGASYYRVYSYNPATKAYDRLAQTSATSFTVTGLKGGTQYTFLVRAFSTTQGSDYTTADNESCTTLPDKPRLRLSDARENSLSFTWSKVTGANFYRIYSFDTQTKKYERLAQVTETAYTLGGLKSGSTNHLLIRAFADNSNGSSYTDADVQLFHSVPVKPQLTLAAYSYSVKLSWNKVAGADFYRVYAYDPTSGKYERLAQTTATAWEHGYLEGNSAHTYLVRAFINGGWGSAYTAADHRSITTRLAKPAFTLKATDAEHIRVSWPADKGAAYYKVFLYDTKSKKYTALVNTQQNEYTYTAAQGGREYAFLVRAYRANGEGSSYSAANCKKVVTPMQKAAFTLASTAKGVVDIKWSAVPYAAFYRVYAYDKASGKYQRLAQTTATAYRFKSLSSGKQYNYLVRAFSASGIAADYKVSDNRSVVVK